MPTLYNIVHIAVNSFCSYKVYILWGDRQRVSSQLTQCWVVILFWKIKRIRGWGGCSFEIRWSRGSFWGGDIWFESCHYFYYTKYWGLIIIFGAVGFSEVYLQRFWLIWRISWGVGALVTVTFWDSDPASFGLVLFFLLSVFLGQSRGRDEAAHGLLALLQSRLSISLLSRFVSSWAAEPCFPVVCMPSLQKAWPTLHPSLHRSDNLNAFPGMVTTSRGQLTSAWPRVPEFWGPGTGWRIAAVGLRLYFSRMSF